MRRRRGRPLTPRTWSSPHPPTCTATFLPPSSSTTETLHSRVNLTGEQINSAPNDNYWKIVSLRRNGSWEIVFEKRGTEYAWHAFYSEGSAFQILSGLFPQLHKNSLTTESKRSWIMFERDALVQDDMASRNSNLYTSSIVDVMKLSVALEGVL